MLNHECPGVTNGARAASMHFMKVRGDKARLKERNDIGNHRTRKQTWGISSDEVVWIYGSMRF